MEKNVGQFFDVLPNSLPSFSSLCTYCSNVLYIRCLEKVNWEEMADYMVSFCATPYHRHRN